MEQIYFDHAATTPVAPEVLRAMEPYFTARFGNASSPHALGRQAQKALEDARTFVASFIGASPEEIIFNGGATEGNNHALFGVARANRSKGNHLIVSAIEHHSVLEPAEQLKRDGFEVSYLPVDEFGSVRLEALNDMIKPSTILVAVMMASNEIGTIQPIAQIAEITRKHKIPLLVDAVQAAGHLPINVNALGADLLTLSAHKFYGPKGVGILYIRKGTVLESYLWGGDQERSRRASTQNVAGAVGCARALQLCQEKMPEDLRIQTRLRDKLIKEVPQIVQGAKVNGPLTNRLCHNAHFSFSKVEGESLLMRLDMEGICASMGSACTSGAMEPSHVLRAIGLSDELAYGSLRITLGRANDAKQVDRFLAVLPSVIESLRV